MKFPPIAAIALALALTLGDTGCGCIGARKIKRPYPEPSAQTLLAHLSSVRDRARSYQVESLMDYWIGKDRVKGKVLLMGQVGARVRINALMPTGDSVAADLACDGVNFQFVDSNNNCQLSGPCSRDSIAQLLRVSLEPDDFLLLVMGTTPVIADARGTVRWDSRAGHEILELRSPDGSRRQTITLDGRKKHWDVVSSVVRDGAGKVLWRLRNKGFHAVEGKDGTRFRVPEKSQFKQPRHKADLLVRWRSHILNLELDAPKFQLGVVEGLPSC